MAGRKRKAVAQGFRGGFRAWESQRISSIAKLDALIKRPGARPHQYVDHDGEFINPDDRFFTDAVVLEYPTPAPRKGLLYGMPKGVKIPLAGCGEGSLGGDDADKESKWTTKDKSSASPSEETFHNRPSVQIPMPDHLKSLLVDDWENVTKNQQLVPIPHPHPVDTILADYIAHERQVREEGSVERDLMEETMAGMREYFDKCLGRILLYRFERIQYIEMYEAWNNGKYPKHKSPADTYGAEHLCRLLVSMPELLAQTNMDTQSVNRLREEMTRFTNWFGKHAAKYFVSEYENTAPEYVEKARNA